MPLLSVEALKTYYFIRETPVKAVDGISFTLNKGEFLGIAGESGCGKSTAALSIMRLIKGGRIMEGSITLDGISLLDLPVKEFNRIRWKRISLVSQAAMGALNPVARIGDQIVEAIVCHTKTATAEARRRAGELLRQVEIDPLYSRNYPHELSGGMRQRAMIAMALALDPDIIIADEPTTALDVITQAQILKLMKRLQERTGIAVIFISHDLSILAAICDKIMIMYAGRIVESGGVRAIFEDSRHPYTRALLDSFPDIGAQRYNACGIPGRPPDLAASLRGCAFHPRCSFAQGICREEEPALIGGDTSYSVACHRNAEYRQLLYNKEK